MNSKIFLSIILVVDFLFLLYGVHTLSISYKEAHIFFEEEHFLHYLTHFSTWAFGQNDYALRAPFILVHLLSIVLIYQISTFYLKKESDRLLSALLFVLLPGVVSSALLVNSASMVIFFTLLFIYLFLRKKPLYYMPLLFFTLFIDNAFIVLYLALVAYGMQRKNRAIMTVAALLFLGALYIYGFPMNGKPRGYFLDTFSAYALIFSPILFLYFFYTMYRILVREQKSILWVISFTALLVSLTLSFRQRIMIEDFAPFVVVSIPLMVQVFMRSYRTRLPELRRMHTLLFIIIFIFLILNFLATYFNQYFYRFIKNPEKHFAYKFHVAYELSEKLHDLGIDALHCKDKKMQLRLRFYGIKEGGDIYIEKGKKHHDSVTISYVNRPLVNYNVTKLNK